MPELSGEDQLQCSQVTPSPSGSLPRWKKKNGRYHPTVSSPFTLQSSTNSAVGSQAQNSRSFIRACQRAKRVRFFRNGDQFFKGIWCAVTPDRFRTFDTLLEDLTRSLDDLVNLPHGVRHIFSIDGLKKITQLEHLEDGCSYVCASNESFKRIDYENAREPVWNYAMAKQGRGSDGTLSLDFSPVVTEPNSFVRPRIITVIRNGVKPRKVIRLLLNKRTAPSCYQVLSDITAAVKLDSGAVKKLFSLDGKLITNLSDFFQDDYVFLAYGTERCSVDDFYLDSEDSYGQAKPSPWIRRKFLHQRNQKKLRPRNRKTEKQGFVQTTNDVYLDQSSPSPDHIENDTEEISDDFFLAKPHPLEIENRFQIGRVLGDGNFAVVHECVCKLTTDSLALKIIDKSKCSGKEELVENEIALLRGISHEYIVRLYDVFESVDRYYLSMELIQGGDLFDALVSVRQYPEPEAANLMGSLAGALDYLHGIGIVHRDVKPENLLVCNATDGKAKLKLADFGLASRADQLLYTVCGTPTYVAPEILAETGYGLKVDIWAAGVILYIMLCGFPPFISMQNSQEELFNLILSGSYSFLSPFWDNISSAAKGLIQGMLQLDIEDRYSAEEILIHPWITPSRSFFEDDNVEFHYSKRRSMDDLSVPSQTEIQIETKK